jgi:hypothetical protein
LPPPSDDGRVERLLSLLGQTGKPIVVKEDLKKLDAYEQAEASRLGQAEYKLHTDQEMLAVMGLA